MKTLATVFTLIIVATIAHAEPLIGEWVEINSGLGMVIQADGVIILNSREKNRIMGAWSKTQDDKIKVSYTEKGQARKAEVKFLFRGDNLVFPATDRLGDSEEVYKRVSESK